MMAKARFSAENRKDASRSQRLFVAVRSIDQFDPYYFDDHAVGVEIQDLLQSDVSDNAIAAVTARYRERLARFRGPVALHACLPAGDPLADAQTLASRYRKMIAVARELKAGTVVFHSGIDPAALAAGGEAYLGRLAAFWDTLRADIESAGITAALENVHEDDYLPLLALVRKIDSPRVGICLDLGHQHLNSRQVIEEWIFNLSHHIRHIHIHANSGTDDAHAPLDDAALRRFIALCADHDVSSAVSFEYREMTAELLRREVERLRGAVGDVSGGTARFPGHIRNFLLQIVLPAALALALFSTLIFAFIIPKYEDIIIDQKREMIRELVRSAVSVATRLEKDVVAGHLSADAARREATQLIGQMRYGAELKDYFWITDMHPRMIVHPYRSDLNGKDLTGFTDPGGKHLFAEFVAAVQSNGGGYVDYRWQWKDDPNMVVAKLSYVEGFAPWGWIIGTGMYIEDVRNEIASIERQLVLIALGITMLVALILAYLARAGFRIDRKRMITEESLRAAREKYRLLVEASTEGILMCADGGIIFSNAPARSMLGWNEHEIGGISDEFLFDGSDSAVAAWRSAGKRTAARFETPVRTKSGIPFEALVIITPVTFAGREGIIIILRSTAATGELPAHAAYDLSSLERNGGKAVPEIQAMLAAGNVPVTRIAAVPVFIHYNDRIAHAAGKISAADSGAAIITGDREEPLGIVTDAIIRDRVARADDPAQPVHSIMHAPVTFIAEHTSAFEADIAAERAGFSWLAVRNEQGAVTGMLHRSTELRVHPTAQLIRAIYTARSADEIRALHDRLPGIAAAYIDGGLTPRVFCRSMTAVTDAIIGRYCALVEADIGPPPGAYAFMTLGSVARGEQTLISDQDNAIVFSDGGRSGYFHELGQRVCMQLNKTGYEYCDGQVMAKSDRWCVSQEQWKAYYDGWVRSGSPEDVLDLSIFFDIRSGSAGAALVDELKAYVLRLIPDNKPLLHYFARAAHSRRLPLGPLGNLQSDMADGRKELDLKQVMMTAVDTARVFALHFGMPETNTIERIGGLMRRGFMVPQDAEAIIAAYGSLMDLRLGHQLRCIAEHQQPDNLIGLKTLSEFEYDMLRAAVSRIGVFQRMLEREFSISG